jgi:Ni,Fe-hydrogenase I large subunit
MIGIPYGQWTQTFTKQDGSTSAPTQAGVEQLRAAQSYDPCIACAVH